MLALDAFKKEWRELTYYGRFEKIALRAVLFLLGVITAYTIVLVGIQLFDDLRLGESFLEKAALQETFGSILTILILLEFNHSVFVALTERSGAIQARIVVLIAVLVVARKLMLQDFASTTLQTMLGFNGLLLSLGGLYWLISDGNRRLVSAASRASPDTVAARLEHAEAIIELQKKLRRCWASQRRATAGLDGRRGGYGAGQRLDRRRLHSA